MLTYKLHLYFKHRQVHSLSLSLSHIHTHTHTHTHHDTHTHTHTHTHFTLYTCEHTHSSGHTHKKPGKKISTSKEELVHFLEHCGIQINNPVSILHQDTSRNFLHSSSPAARYELFMKATRLEQMDVDYDKCKEEQKLMCDSIEQKKKVSSPFYYDE